MKILLLPICWGKFSSFVASFDPSRRSYFFFFWVFIRYSRNNFAKVYWFGSHQHVWKQKRSKRSGGWASHALLALGSQIFSVICHHATCRPWSFDAVVLEAREMKRVIRRWESEETRSGSTNRSMSGWRLRLRLRRACTHFTRTLLLTCRGYCKQIARFN